MPLHAQWANFLRNHDELSLDKLTDVEREEAFATLGPDEEMRLYGRGVRRRMAPMLGGDARRLELAHALLFSLPGTPVMWYGDEIGMGEDLAQDERWAVRTPMQWSGERHGGFSGTRGETVVPAISEGPFAFEKINVEDQKHRAGSLLSRVRAMVRTRRSAPEIGCGSWAVVDGLPSSVFGLSYDRRGRPMQVFANLSDSVAEIPGTAVPEAGGRVEIASDHRPGTVIEAAPFSLPAYGYLWLRPLSASKD